jgi:hypothetical protein
MIHPPQTAALPRKTREQDTGTPVEDAVETAAQPPPALDTRLRAIAPSPRRAPGGFFRDPEAFHALAGLVPALFRG